MIGELCYRRDHSIELVIVFNLSNTGIDYYSDGNLGAEFKETKSRKKIRGFRVKKRDLRADLFVFVDNLRCVYIVEADMVTYYSFKGGSCYISTNTAKKVCIKSFELSDNNILSDLKLVKDYIDNLEV